MKRYTNRLLTLCFTCFVFLGGFHIAHAGMPGPYQIVFLDISEAPYQDGQSLMKQLRALDANDPGEAFGETIALDEGYRNGACFSCRGGMDSYDSIGIMYLYTIPVGLTVEDARKAVAGDTQAKDRMQKILQAFSDHDGATLHGIVLYEHKDGEVTLYATEAKVGASIKSVSKSVKNYLRLNSLDALMYQITSQIHRDV